MEESVGQQGKETTTMSGILAACIVYVIVCILLFSYGLPLLDLAFVIIVMGGPIELIRRRSYVRERHDSQ